MFPHCYKTLAGNLCGRNNLRIDTVKIAKISECFCQSALLSSISRCFSIAYSSESINKFKPLNRSKVFVKFAKFFDITCKLWNRD
ncbi:hypothetical protein F8M41_024878 [Gigaspora margarita]|uniref:Uncharacterized protein n=1 Tax=Gigaspora margarita TaxID=4874 RepID=A0A8H3XNL0_GIGMA|nr:hypothetical protein F8M41_024878 [Gigaspora margarita]